MSHINYKNGQIIHPDKTTLYLTTFDEHDDTTFEFQKPPTLRGEQFEIGLTKMKIWTTMQNVHPSLNNTVLEIFTSGGVLLATVNFPSGNYTLGEINQVIQRKLITLGLASNRISFDGNSSTGKITISLLPDTSITFAGVSAGFGELLGGVPGSYSNTGANIIFIDLPNEPKLNYFYNPSTNSSIEINSIYVNCDLVNTRMYGNSENNNKITVSSHSVIYKLTLQGANIFQTEEPYSVDFMHMKSVNDLHTVRIYLTNQNNIPMKGMITKPILYSLKMKEY